MEPKAITREQVLFIKSNLQGMLNARSVDQVVGMVHVLLSYVEMIHPEPIELWLSCPAEIQNKIGVIKEIRGCLDIGLKEAKDLTEQTLNPIYRGEDVNLALRLHQAVSKYARTEMRGASPAMAVLFGQK